MKNFVIALAIMLMASCGATPQENPRRNLSYIGWKVEQVQKDTPEIHKLSTDDLFLQGEPEIANYGKTWIAYVVKMGVGSVKLFKFELESGLCFEEQTQTVNSTIATALLMVYDLFLEEDLTEDGKGVLVSVPNNPNKRMLFEYRESTSISGDYYVFKVMALKPIKPNSKAMKKGSKEDLANRRQMGLTDPKWDKYDFDEMMKRKPVNDDSWDFNSVFTDEEIIFMGNYDLPKFGAKFPNEAEYFMDELDDGRL